METGQSCAFTGYRPSRFPFGTNERDPQCKRIKLALLNAIQWLHDEKGVKRFYSGCAMGVDLWAASAVLYLRGENGYEDIQLFCAIPFQGHADRWEEEQKIKLERILSQCDEKEYVSEKYSDEVYFVRNKFMVDRAQYLVGVYDIRQKGTRSGTGQTIRYAIAKERNIFIIDPLTAEVKRAGTK